MRQYSLFADMVKNKGFLPSGPSEIPVQRNQMREIIYSLLPACKEPDVETGIPFRADAIIANPPAYGLISTLICLLSIKSSFWNLQLIDVVHNAFVTCTCYPTIRSKSISVFWSGITQE